MAEKIKISKVKLIKGGDKLEVEYAEQGILKSSNDKICDNPVHPDLTSAVQTLAVHLAILTGYIPEKKCHDNEEVQKFIVSGYSVGGREGQEGVIIMGRRITKYGDVILNTPFIRFEAGPESEYVLMNNVIESLNTIEFEVNELLFNGKVAPNPQQQLDFGDEPVTKALIASPEGEEENLADGGIVHTDDLDVPLPDKKKAAKRGRGKAKSKDVLE